MSPVTEFVVMRVGDALVITPHDKAFAEVTGKLEAALRESGADVEDLIKAAEEARAQIVREEFGDLVTTSLLIG
jgi:hypothetical protein